MFKKIVQKVFFLAMLSASAVFSAGLEDSNHGDYKAYTYVKVSLVITDESGYMGVLLTKIDDPSDRMWFWARATDNQDAYKSMLSTALSAQSQGAPVNAIVSSTGPTYSFMDSSGKGERKATNRLAQIWVESP